MRIKGKEKRSKIKYKKLIYGYQKDCEDEFGKYKFYFKIYLCFSIVDGFSWLIETSDLSTNQKKLRHCLNTVLNHLEEDNPRYYRLYEKYFRQSLQIRELRNQELL